MNQSIARGNCFTRRPQQSTPHHSTAEHSTAQHSTENLYFTLTQLRIPFKQSHLPGFFRSCANRVNVSFSSLNSPPPTRERLGLESNKRNERLVSPAGETFNSLTRGKCTSKRTTVPRKLEPPCNTDIQRGMLKKKGENSQTRTE